MDKNKILKILGYIFLPMLPLTIAIYFLFPYFNEEKHQQIVESNEPISLADSLGVQSDSDIEKFIGEDFETVKEYALEFQQDAKELKKQVDSLAAVNDSLENEIIAKEEELADLRVNNNATELVESEEGERNEKISNEELSENVKSLLGLDNEDLAPIINEMSDSQLIRLYEIGSSLQRKKLLRALDSKRAAKLMTEVM